MNDILNRQDRICVIGAGTSGLAGARRLLQWGFDVDVVERADDLGGNWNSSSPWSRVFNSTHLVSSNHLTEYPDFPMPDGYPDFPSHQQAQRYLQAYADRFRLREHIRFGVSVQNVRRPADGAGWLVTFDDGSCAHYAAVVIGNGHNWSPRLPSYPGQFDGRIIHASEYHNSEVLRGRRVVVVGAGNSGCDIACEAAQVADLAVHSLRRGYHIMPKYVGKWPTDLFAEFFLRLRVPLWLRRSVGTLILKVYGHELWRYGYPRPDHRLWESHLVLNGQLAHFAAHGRITPKPDIDRFAGPLVWFTDGTSVHADLVVFATGYRTELPFLDPALLSAAEGVPPLYLNLFHPEFDDLFVLGLMQPSQGQWQLVDHQARAVAAFCWAVRNRPDRADRFRGVKRRPSPRLGGPIKYVPSPRHRIELDHNTYRQRLRRIVRLLAGSYDPPVEPAIAPTGGPAASRGSGPAGGTGDRPDARRRPEPVAAVLER
jgi:glycine/D-amino acid oxidase-like deaminating enzyme